MNKTWTAAMIAALLPLTFSASAADTAKLHTDKVMAVPVTEKKILPVDLDQASASQDVVLPQQPVHMTADTFVARNSDGYGAMSTSSRAWMKSMPTMSKAT